MTAPLPHNYEHLNLSKNMLININEILAQIMTQSREQSAQIDKSNNGNLKSIESQRVESEDDLSNQKIKSKKESPQNKLSSGLFKPILPVSYMSVSATSKFKER